MTITDQCGVCIVVELQCLLAPQDAHGHGRLEDGLEQQPQAAGQLSGTPSTVTPQSCRRIRSLISL